jgi:hypothetical protein
MLYQGMNVPLMVDTIVEYVGGQVANDEAAHAVERDGNDDDSELLADLDGGEMVVESVPETIKKVLQNKATRDEM